MGTLSAEPTHGQHVQICIVDAQTRSPQAATPSCRLISKASTPAHTARVARLDRQASLRDDQQQSHIKFDVALHEARREGRLAGQARAAFHSRARGRVKADIELQTLSAVNDVLDRLGRGGVASRVVLDFVTA